jgi:glycosyltransferase involved in cell wall biosynthesis
MMRLFTAHQLDDEGSQRPRVLHCVPSMEGGGTERQLVYLAGALTAQGWDVHVALNAGGPNLADLERTGATIHQLRGYGNHDPRMLGRLCRLIDVLRPDLVQCWLLQMEIAGGLAALAKRVPWILSERSSIEAYPPRMKHRLRIAIGGRARAIVANSPAGDDYWRDRINTRVPRYIVPNALPLEAIASAPVAAPDEAGVVDGQALILFAGRFEESKGAETLVRALGRLPRRLLFRAHLYGSGPRRAHVEQLLIEHKLESHVRVMGYTSRLWNVMKRASVLVAPSRFEGSPNVVLEAMACRCPLAVSNIRGHRDILDHESARMFEPGDISGIARAIEEVLMNTEDTRRRAAVASSRVGRHSVTVIAREYIQIYRYVLSEDRIQHSTAGKRAS